MCRLPRQRRRRQRMQLLGRHIRPAVEIVGVRLALLGRGSEASCLSPPALLSMAARLERLRGTAQLYGGKAAISKGLGGLYEGLYRTNTGYAQGLSGGARLTEPRPNVSSRLPIFCAKCFNLIRERSRGG